MADAISSLIINSVHSILLVWTTEMGGETRTHRGQTYVRSWHKAVRRTCLRHSPGVGYFPFSKWPPIE